MAQPQTLCILGCGNLGTAILSSLLNSPNQLFSHYIACVRSISSQTRLQSKFSNQNLSISVNENVSSVEKADVVILALDPAVLESGLKEPGLADAVAGKLLISVAAGWTVQRLEETLYPNPPLPSSQEKRASIIRTLPNIAAQVSQSLTAIELNPSNPPAQPHLDLTEKIFSSVGATLQIPPSLIDATTAVAGSTPAMFGVLVDAMVDGAVAVGVPRAMASAMVVQAMRGSADMLATGMTASELRDQGTSPEGCTIGGVMVLEERGVRGGVGRAVREAVSVARRMGTDQHLNDTR